MSCFLSLNFSCAEARPMPPRLLEGTASVPLPTLDPAGCHASFYSYTITGMRRLPTTEPSL